MDDSYGHDAAHDRRGPISSIFKVQTVEDQRTFARWARGVALFYCLMLLVGGAILFASAESHSPARQVARASPIQNGR